MAAAGAKVVVCDVGASLSGEGGSATPAQISGFAVAMRMKRPTSAEVTELADTMLKHARRIPAALIGDRAAEAVDIVGTGGDGSHTFNISTCAMFVAAAAGAGDGLKLALNVGAMLLAFTALIALLNWPIQAIGDATGIAGAIVGSVFNFGGATALVWGRRRRATATGRDQPAGSSP